MIIQGIVLLLYQRDILLQNEWYVPISTFRHGYERWLFKSSYAPVLNRILFILKNNHIEVTILRLE